MVSDVKDALLFMIEIYKGNLLHKDMVLLAVILFSIPIAESTQEARRKRVSLKGAAVLFQFMKWIPLAFLVCSIYLTGFYFVTNLLEGFFEIPAMFNELVHLQSYAIMSLTMSSILSVILSIWDLHDWFFSRYTAILMALSTVFISLGLFFIMSWYGLEGVPIWVHLVVGLINIIFMMFLMKEHEELSDVRSIRADLTE